MEYMLLFTKRREDPEPGDAERAEMKAFAEELAREGRLRRGAPLAPETDGVRIRVRDGRAEVTDGPFAESKEVVAGFFVVEAASREEALDVARRCPHARCGTVEVHPFRFRDSVADPGRGTPFLLAFRREPGLADCDGTKLRTMMEFADALKNGTLIETAPLAEDPPPARVRLREGAPLVTDGPFAEAKEAVGGYSLVRVGDRAEAIELAKRYPHATWGPVEVREILAFDPV